MLDLLSQEIEMSYGGLLLHSFFCGLIAVASRDLFRWMKTKL